MNQDAEVDAGRRHGFCRTNGFITGCGVVTQHAVFRVLPYAAVNGQAVVAGITLIKADNLAPWRRVAAVQGHVDHRVKAGNPHRVLTVD